MLSPSAMSSWPKHWASLSARTDPVAKESIGAAAQAAGCVDDVALIVEGGAPRGFFVRGWAALSEGWSAYGALTLVLRNERCSFEVAVEREPREDVQRAHGYQHAGYLAHIPVEPLFDGDYELAVMARSGARSALLASATVLSVRDGKAQLPEMRQKPLLHVIHVPKTGGTSFRRMLEHAFGSGLMLHYEGPLLVAARTRCVQGHSYASNLTLFNPDVQLAMWFRDPVERVVSEYFHWRRNPETHPLEGADLLSFARRRNMVNTHRRCLDGVPLSRLSCVCITEYFEASVALFCRVFDLNPANLASENTNPDKPVAEPYALPRELREQLLRANLADLELYERAQERFRSLCRAHGVSLPKGNG
jgi:hypothetical protein